MWEVTSRANALKRKSVFFENSRIGLWMNFINIANCFYKNTWLKRAVNRNGAAYIEYASVGMKKLFEIDFPLVTRQRENTLKILAYHFNPSSSFGENGFA